jgi:hypothetical protein
VRELKGRHAGLTTPAYPLVELTPAYVIAAAAAVCLVAVAVAAALASLALSRHTTLLLRTDARSEFACFLQGLTFTYNKANETLKVGRSATSDAQGVQHLLSCKCCMWCAHSQRASLYFSVFSQKITVAPVKVLEMHGLNVMKYADTMALLLLVHRCTACTRCSSEAAAARCRSGVQDAAVIIVSAEVGFFSRLP